MYDGLNVDNNDPSNVVSHKAPHRPAPPVPSSKVKLSTQNSISTQSGEEIQKFDSVANKKKSRYNTVN